MASQIALFEKTNFLFFPSKIRLEMAEIWPKVAKQLAMAIMGDQLVASQTASQIVLFDQTNFVFYPIKIQLEMAEIWPKVAKQLATAILGDQLVASQMASQIILIEQTDFLIYPIKIRLEMAEVLSKVIKIASHGKWLVRLYQLSRPIFSFIQSKSDLKWLRYSQK